MKKNYILIQLFTSSVLLLSSTSYCQVEVALRNSSFEGEPAMSKVPLNWFDCGWSSESPPNTEPTEFQSNPLVAHDGETYLGLVTRDNETWERVTQRLETPLVKNQTYLFQIFLAKAKDYLSKSKLTNLPANYNTATSFKIWGGNNYCKRVDLLGTINSVSNLNWKKYEFIIMPQSNHEYIMFEAYYSEANHEIANGNLLMDNASSFKPLQLCDTILRRKSTEYLDSVICFIDSKYEFEKREGNYFFSKIVAVSKKIEIEITNSDFRQYILNQSREESEMVLSILKELELTELFKIYQKALSIVTLNKKDEASQSDLEYFNNSGEVFRETLLIENFGEARKIYLEKNRILLIEELLN